jgi:integrase
MSIRKKTWNNADGSEGLSLFADVKVKLPDGTIRRHRETLPTRSEAEARAMEKKIRAALILGQPIPTFEVEEAPAPEPVRPVKATPTFADFETQFIRDYAEVKNKPSEVTAKKHLLKKHLVPAFGKFRLSAITELEIDSYIARQVKAGLKPKTINNHLAVVAKMLRQAKRWKLIAEIPCIDWLKVGDQPFDFLSFDEVPKLLAGASEEPWRTMMIVALKTGLRPSELRALRWQDVDFKGQKLNVRLGEYRGRTETPKDGDSREVSLSPEALDALRRHPHHLKSPLVFWDAADGGNLTEHAMRLAIARAVAKAKFPRDLGWYVFRHTFASHLVMRGVSLKAVGELMGHSSMEMTMRYAHLSPAIKQDAVKLLDLPCPAAAIPA